MKHKTNTCCQIIMACKIQVAEYSEAEFPWFVWFIFRRTKTRLLPEGGPREGSCVQVQEHDRYRLGICTESISKMVRYEDPHGGARSTALKTKHRRTSVRHSRVAREWQVSQHRCTACEKEPSSLIKSKEIQEVWKKRSDIWYARLTAPTRARDYI